MGEQAEPEPLLEWGPAGWQRRVGVWLTVTLGSSSLLYLGMVEMFGDQVPELWPVLVLQPVLTMLPWVLYKQRSGLRVDDRGIEVHGRALLRGSWRWDELLEVAVGSGVDTGPAVAVRPQGSTWDTPGPLAPAIAPVRNREMRERAHAVLSRECSRRGIAFTDHPDGLGTARPGSPLRRDG